MTVEQVNRFLDAAKAAVMEQLPAILARRFDVSYKPDGSPVTSGDHLVEALVGNVLADFLPEAMLVAEESYRNWDVTSQDVIVVLDPVDGTENFCSGMPEWGTSIGVWSRGEHLGSSLLLPELGLGVRSGQPLTQQHRSRITGFSSSFHPAIARGIEEATEYRVTGCAVYNLFNVARGTFSRFINPKGAYVWDLLPGLMIAKEHGCEVYLNDEIFDGRFVDPTQKYRVDVRCGSDRDPREGA